MCKWRFAPIIILGSVFLIGVVIGDELSDRNIKSRLVSLAADMFAKPVESEVKEVIWERISTNLHELEIAHFQFGFDFQPGGALEEVDGVLIFVTARGGLGYITPAHEIYFLDLRAPINLKGLEKSSLLANPLFVPSWVRAIDLYADPLGDGNYDLYLTHHRYGDDCFSFVLSKLTVSVQDDGDIIPGTDSWDTVLEIDPCIPQKATSYVFAGHQAGGRIERLDADTLLLSTGDFEFDGVNAPSKVSMDSNSLLGKILAVDIHTYVPRVYASGVRNPQGLLTASDGRVWETEHGPKGGDELNLIIEGENYGWPEETLGTQYGSPSQDWPNSRRQGRHDQYRAPQYAFLPSIGVSGVAEADAAEFPLWHGDLLIASLKEMALYRARLDGDRVVYVEKIPIGARIRDVTSVGDGRIAMMLDTSHIAVLRNAEKGDGVSTFVMGGWDRVRDFSDKEEAELNLEGFSPDPPEKPSEAETLSYGRQIFAARCAACHDLDGGNHVGPRLAGIVGRQVGGLEGYTYSEALRRADDAWTETGLTEFIVRADQVYPGTTMPAYTVREEHAPFVVEYLKTLK